MDLRQKRDGGCGPTDEKFLLSNADDGEEALFSKLLNFL
jgi:hypothetical protein